MIGLTSWGPVLCGNSEVKNNYRMCQQNKILQFSRISTFYILTRKFSSRRNKMYSFRFSNWGKIEEYLTSCLLTSQEDFDI